jgi:predicted phosphodiesterase
MKIQCLSDTHFEFWPDLESIKEFIKSERTDCDVLVLAGDILKLKHNIETWPEAIFNMFSENFKEIVYIPGNHEYYSWSIADGSNYLSILLSKFENLHLLTNDNVYINGDHKFLGNTLWFPKRAGDEPISKYINDFRLISDIQYAYELNTQTRKMLSEEVNENTIVVVHHLPSWLCVAQEFMGDRLNRFFVGDIEDIILEKKPRVVVYGHDHRSSELHTLFKRTLVTSNQYGYKHEKYTSGYRSQFIIEL